MKGGLKLGPWPTMATMWSLLSAGSGESPEHFSGDNSPGGPCLATGIDPTALFPVYTPWPPSLALPMVSPQFLVGGIQHPGQSPGQPYSGTSFEHQPRRLLTVPLLFQPLSLCSCCAPHLVCLAVECSESTVLPDVLRLHFSVSTPLFLCIFTTSVPPL